MRFTVPEKFLSESSRSADSLDMTVPELSGKEYKAKVVELSPIVDPTSGTFDGMLSRWWEHRARSAAGDEHDSAH